MSKYLSQLRQLASRCALRPRNSRLTRRQLRAPLAVELLEERTMLSATDLAITLSANQVAAEQGSEISYDITVTNNGPEAVTDANVTNAVSSFLDGASWTATLNGGAIGDTSGTGDIDETVELPVGGSIHYVLTGTVKGDAFGSIANSAAVSSPSNTDPDPDNNTDSDSDLLFLRPMGGSDYFVKGESDSLPGVDHYDYVEIADFNGDGWNDVLVIDSGIEDEMLRLGINQRDGTFSVLSQEFPGGQIESYSIGDVDQDGDLDLFLARDVFDGTNNSYLLLNDGTGQFSISEDNELPESRGSVMADFNSDGHLDLILHDLTNGKVSLWINDGTGIFTGPMFLSDTYFGGDPPLMEAGDIDNDGDTDLFVSILGADWDNYYVYQNDGEGNFNEVEYHTVFYHTRQQLLGDLDNDGDLDYITLQWSSSPNVSHTVWLNNGDGTFVASANEIYSVRTFDGDLADIDDDGDLDLVMGGTYLDSYVGYPQDNIWLNDGSGYFSPSPHQLYDEQGGELRIGDITVGDLNGDGTLDLVTGTTFGPGELTIWYNSPSGEVPYQQNFETDSDGMKFISPSTTQVINHQGNQLLQFDNSGYTGLSVAVVDTLKPLPEVFDFSGELTAVGGPNRLQNGFLIFDYQNETDFKFAGMFPGQNQWIIGHYQGNWSNRIAQVDWDDEGRSINANQPYDLEVKVEGSEVRFFVDGEFVTKGNFSGNVNSGKVGVASFNAVMNIDNLDLKRGRPHILDYYEDFNTVFPVQFDFNNLAHVSVQQQDGAGTLQIDTTGSAGLGLAVHTHDEPLPSIWRVSSDIQAVSGPNRWQDGFIIFDYQNENDFKYAGMFNGQNQWVIGHYEGNWGNRLLSIDGDDFGFQIDADVFYHVEVEAIGNLIYLSVDGVLIGMVEFEEGLDGGSVGLAAYNAETIFDEFRFYREGEPVLPQSVGIMYDFESPSYDDFTFYHNASKFSFEEGFDGKGLVYENYSGSSSDRYGIAVLEGLQPLPHNFDYSVEMVGRGRLIFDWRDENNFKYVDFYGRLYEVNNAEYPGTRLLSDGIPGYVVAEGEVINLHLSVRGRFIEVFVDQVKLLEYEFDESQLNLGALGVIASDSLVKFDNIKISEEASPQGDFDPTFRFDMEFGDAPDELFDTNPGNAWKIVDGEPDTNGRRRLEVDSSTGSPLATALIHPLDNIPDSFEMMVEMTAVAQPGSWQDGFIIFDYNSPTDFKYAGMLAGQNQWVVGHYQNGFGDRELSVDWDDTGRTINPGEVYLVHIKIDGAEVELRVDTEVIGTAVFDAPVNGGRLGLGNYKGKTSFDNFRIGKDVPQGDDIDFDYSNNLYGYYNSSDRPFFEVNRESVSYFQVNDVLRIDATSQNTVGAFILPSEGLPANYRMGVEFRSRSEPQPFRTGFIIFDYKNENDFKFAGALVTQNRWVIGHYQGHFGNRLADVNWADEGREIHTNNYYELELNVSGADVELLVDGESIADVSFSQPVNAGEVGFGVKGSSNHFRNFEFEVTTPSPAAVDAAFSSTETEPLTI